MTSRGQKRLLVVVLALPLLPAPARAGVDEMAVDFGALYSGGTPFLSHGGSELTLGGGGFTDESFGDARLNVFPILADWALGRAVNSSYPISGALSPADTSRAWLPFAEMTGYWGRNGPAAVFGLALNAIPLDPATTNEDRFALPLYLGGAWILQDKGKVVIAPSATIGWSPLKNTGLYADGRLLVRLRLGHSAGVYLRGELMYQAQINHNVTGTLIEAGFSFWTKQ